MAVNSCIAPSEKSSYCNGGQHSKNSRDVSRRPMNESFGKGSLDIYLSRCIETKDPSGFQSFFAIMSFPLALVTMNARSKSSNTRDQLARNFWSRERDVRHARQVVVSVRHTYVEDHVQDEDFYSTKGVTSVPSLRIPSLRSTC